ncbi:MAG: archaetidylinositol phosphate synthase [Candidatus Bathyarchaeota archaeon]
MLTKLKKRFQVLLAAEAEVAISMGLTPNIVSGLGIVLAFLSALTYISWQIHTFYILLATFLLLLSGFCDALDGVMARLHFRTTAFGGFLDSMLDRYADAAVYSGIIFSGLSDLSWGLAALIGSLLVSYSRARAEAAGIKIESIGLVERAERIIILSVASIIAAFWLPKETMSSAIILLAILSNLTVLQRAAHVYKKLQDNE